MCAYVFASTTLVISSCIAAVPVQKVYVPVDLSLIMRRIAMGDYGRNPSRIPADVRLLISNARLSHHPQSSTYAAATMLSKRFEVRARVYVCVCVCVRTWLVSVACACLRLCLRLRVYSPG